MLLLLICGLLVLQFFVMLLLFELLKRLVVLI
jgi:hypothetical protein